MVSTLPLAPVFHNHLFLPSCSDPVFQTWSHRGLHSIKDLYTNGIFTSFADLSVKFGLPNNHLFRFFQIRHFIQNQLPLFPNRPPDSVMVPFLTLHTIGRGLTLVIYNYIFKINPECLDSLRAIWDQDLRITMSHDG